MIFLQHDFKPTIHSQAPEWNYELTKQKLFFIDPGPVQDFAVFAYTFGGRLNEIRHLRPTDITKIVIKNGEERITVSLPTEKNPHVTRRNVPLNPYTEIHYADIIWKWKETWDEESKPFRSYSEDYYQRYLRDYLDIHPHALRHLRVHHVDDQEVPGMKPLTPRQFKDFFGWWKIETSAHYQSRTRGKDLAELM